MNLEAGIRQGCPLSPLIFALVSDILLRKLKRQFKGNVLKAYADDLCMVTEDLYRDLEPVTEVFEDFAEISGLHLNMKKIQVVPLWSQDKEEVRRCCGRIHYRWYAAKFDDKAEYLGVFLGPGKGDTFLGQSQRQDCQKG